jgi:hypothetical protein
VRRHGTFSLEQFRQEVAAVTASGTEHIIATYSRKTLKQTGDGHFSPIGGFHPERDLVLILDTGAADMIYHASDFTMVLFVASKRNNPKFRLRPSKR